MMSIERSASATERPSALARMPVAMAPGEIVLTRTLLSPSSMATTVVIHLTTVVAMELGESNVRVNSISPGAIATGILAKALGLSVAEAERSIDIIREAYKKAQPLPRTGLPEDIAQAALFLASDESSFINGHDL